MQLGLFVSRLTTANIQPFSILSSVFGENISLTQVIQPCQLSHFGFQGAVVECGKLDMLVRLADLTAEGLTKIRHFANVIKRKRYVLITIHL